VRAVTAGVAARLDFPIDAIEDLRLAVDEASAHLLSRNPSCARLTIRLTPRPDGLEIQASCNQGSTSWPDDTSRTSMSWHVLAALTDEAAMGRDDHQPMIRFTKHLPGRADPR
jgi:serine/threonine-protein kinase RsbW